MRTILFRYYENSTKKLIHPNENGWFNAVYKHDNGSMQDLRLDSVISRSNDGLGVIQQFTGLTDKNGVKIFFDSDIVSFKMTRSVDTFKECSYVNADENDNRTYKKIELLPCILTVRNPAKGIELYNEEYNIYKPLWVVSDADIKNLEVIGNIHDKK